MTEFDALKMLKDDEVICEACKRPWGKLGETHICVFLLGPNEKFVDVDNTFRRFRCSDCHEQVSGIEMYQIHWLKHIKEAISRLGGGE